MFITTTDLKNLSKNVQTQFSFSVIVGFLNKFIKKDYFKEMLKTVIGQKGEETIKNGQANEITAKMLGGRDYHDLYSEIEKKESLSKGEIIDGIQIILNNLKNDRISHAYNFHLEMVAKNMSGYYDIFADNFAERKEQLMKLPNYVGDDLNIINVIDSLADQKVTSITLDSFNDNGRCEVLMMLGFDKGGRLDIDAVVRTCSVDGDIESIDSELTKINGFYITNSDDLFDDLIEVALIGFTESMGVYPHESKEIKEEDVKRLSLLVSSFK